MRTNMKRHKHRWKNTGNVTHKYVDKYLTLIIAEEICSCGKKRHSKIIGAMRNGSILVGVSI